MTTRQFFLSMWPVHPLALLAAGVLVFAYVRHWRAAGRAARSAPGLLAAAIVLFLLVLDSPLEALANGYLFSAHMLQHLMLQLVVPPFLIWAWRTGSSSNPSAGLVGRVVPSTAESPEPIEVQPQASLKRLRTRQVWAKVDRVVTQPVVTWLAGVGGMWFWHVPALCDAATSSPIVRSVQVVSLLGLGTLFWLPLLGPPSRPHLPPLAGVLYLFTACVGCTLLGIIITFAPVSVCPIYVHPVDTLGLLPLIRNGWGLTPAVDQQIGGLLMWVPACFIYLSGIVGILARWYSEAGEPALSDAAPAPSRTV